MTPTHATEDLTDAERVRGLLEVNARQVETIERQQRTIASMQRRAGRLRDELAELRSRLQAHDSGKP